MYLYLSNDQMDMLRCLGPTGFKTDYLFNAEDHKTIAWLMSKLFCPVSVNKTIKMTVLGDNGKKTSNQLWVYFPGLF